ncbi:MAG: ATP-binding protein [Crocinitomicaceae bacterium]|nr:ATP-binding protein [Crocinitomicaceae bacterium]
MKRIQQQQIIQQLQTSKILLISGPRLAGKEEIIQEVLAELNTNTLQINAGNKKERQAIEESTETDLSASFSAYPLVVIHEAQYLSNLQQIIELVLSDTISSSILLNCSFEPMMDELLKEVLDTQKLHVRIYPPSFYELASHFGLPEEEKMLEQRLIYGNYPAVVLTPEVAEEILSHLLDTVLITDLGVTDRINKKKQLTRVLQTLSFLIGEPVSYNEVAERCDLDNETVERYVLLLEKAYVLIRIPSYSTDKRYELKKSQLIYFVDTGLRNMLINNFNPPAIRMDLDALWKNWLISERVKWNAVNNKQTIYWFWRTHTKQSIDLIEENEGHKIAYKSTWEKKKKLKFPAMFQEYYPEIPTHTLNRSTYWTFLSRK